MERRTFLLGMLGALTAAAGFTVTTTASAGAQTPPPMPTTRRRRTRQPSGPITRSTIAVTRSLSSIAVLLASHPCSLRILLAEASRRLVSGSLENRSPG